MTKGALSLQFGGVTTAKHSGIVRVDNVPLKKLKNRTRILYVLM